jgi:hypothetical protein
VLTLRVTSTKAPVGLEVTTNTLGIVLRGSATSSGVDNLAAAVYSIVH